MVWNENTTRLTSDIVNRVLIQFLYSDWSDTAVYCKVPFCTTRSADGPQNVEEKQRTLLDSSRVVGCWIGSSAHAHRLPISRQDLCTQRPWALPGLPDLQPKGE
jgi:hypothetical protein